MPVDDLQVGAKLCAAKELPGSTHWVHGPGPLYPEGWEACTKVFKAWQRSENDREIAAADAAKAVEQPKAFVDEVVRKLGAR